MKKIVILGFLVTTTISFSQTKNTTQQKATSYWQQHVDYTMDIDMNVKSYRYKGIQKLVYTNNSPDELKKVYYHLYPNAFQPNSQMDIRLQNIADPDSRMITNLGTKEKPQYKSRISTLKPSEIGYIKVKSLKQNGSSVNYKTVGTILEVTLNHPIKSGESTTFDMQFEGQVPLQIRRSGRNNSEGVALSMSQWYPKMAEYDVEGWHADPYIAREFYGVWGSFDVTIHLDKKYVVGGTGYLQNPQEVGYGYQDKNKPLHLPKGKKLVWHFKAPNVHDFTWAADPDYVHDILKTKSGINLHFFYKKTLSPKHLENWKKLQPKTAKLLSYYNKHIGKYPFKQYSVIQGGDGGMEYGMCTLITGERNFGSLFGVVAHEFAHSWFQFVLATNESEHAWMDEGFTTYISHKSVNKILNQQRANPHKSSYKFYNSVVSKNMEEPLTTHSDRFNTNTAYSMGSYSKGCIFLSQLEYVIGEENLEKTLQKYFDDFAFKHPTPNDIKRTAEKVSGINLGWYLNEWIKTTHTIDYGITSVKDKTITLQRIGEMPMPIDISVVYTDGSTENFNIPLPIMRGHKPTMATLLKSWGWAYPTYSFKVSKPVRSVEIDPSKLMADINLKDNTAVVK